MAFEVTVFDTEVRCDLRGHLEAITALEVTKMTFKQNAHEYLSNLRSNLTLDVIEAAMASSATKKGSSSQSINRIQVN